MLEKIKEYPTCEGRIIETAEAAVKERKVKSGPDQNLKWVK